MKKNVLVGRKILTSKGFTLIELLAVIVILSIIALIAVPIILNIVNDSKEETDQRSIEMYAKAVENAITKQQLDGEKIISGSFTTEDGIVLKKGERISLNIDYDGDVLCETIIIEYNGNIYLNDCQVNNEKVDYVYGDEPIYKAATTKNKTTGIVPKQDENGNLMPGSEFKIKVNDRLGNLTFFVLSNEEDYVNLILDRNVYYDSTNDVGGLVNSTNKGLVAWVSKTDYNDEENYGSYGNNDKGPLTSMSYLHNATKEWDNIPNIKMYYTDEGNTKNYGYGTVITEGNMTTITKKDKTTVTATFENLKTRMPYNSEMKAIGCTKTKGCPLYLVDYLLNDQTNYPDRNVISGILGYWTMASYPNHNAYSYSVAFYGNLTSQGTTWGTTVNTSNYYGVRPVITVLKEDLLRVI